MRVIALLGAGVVAVPLFKRLGLGSVLGYLAAGLAIGPFGLALFNDPHAILQVAELGVVMFLFVIGLEMQPSRLWQLRRAIFGLGLLQVVVCGALLTAALMIAGQSWKLSFVAAMGFVLSSTAIVAQILEERGVKSTPAGQRMISILLLEDLMIVPLLAAVALLTPPEAVVATNRWQAPLIAVGALLGLIAVGKYVLSPVFSVLANSRAREVMTAAALLVVLGAAYVMQLGGLSMAMGRIPRRRAAVHVHVQAAAGSRHRAVPRHPARAVLHERGHVARPHGVPRELARVVGGTLLLMAVKCAAVYAVARITRADHREGLYRAALLAQGGEFAFVLYSAATQAGVIDGTANALYTSIVIVSMALTPLLVAGLRPGRAPQRRRLHGWHRSRARPARPARCSSLRPFRPVVSQSLLARGVDVALIDTDTDMIRVAAEFGFKVYYGDGTRLDVLRACGAADARAILVCVDDREAARHIVRMVKSEFPQAQVLARSFDREHALELIADGADCRSARPSNRPCASGSRRCWPWVHRRRKPRRSRQTCASATPTASSSRSRTAVTPGATCCVAMPRCRPWCRSRSSRRAVRFARSPKKRRRSRRNEICAFGGVRC